MQGRGWRLIGFIVFGGLMLGCSGDEDRSASPEVTAGDDPAVVGSDAGADLLETHDPGSTPETTPDGVGGDARDSGAPDDVVAEDAEGSVSVDLQVLPPEGAVVAGVITQADELLGGPKAEAELGDLKMMNAQGAFIIEGMGRSDGYRHWGGFPIDVAPVGADGILAADHFGEMLFAWNLKIFQPQELEVISDGRDGLAHVQLRGTTSALPMADSFLGDLFDFEPITMTVRVDYYLGPHDRALRWELSLTNPGAELIDVSLPLLLASHGDGVYHFEAGAGYDSSPAGPIPALAFAGHTLGYALMAEDDDLSMLFGYQSVWVAQHDGFTLEPGASLVRSYYLALSHEGYDGLAHARRVLIEGDEAVAAVAEIRGTVTLPSSATGHQAWVVASQAGAPHTMSPVAADGSFRCRVAPGEWLIEAYVRGHRAGVSELLTVGAGDSVELALELPASRLVHVEVKDSLGAPVSGRVTFLAQAETPSAHPPGSVDMLRSFSGQVSAVAYAIGGEATVALPPGAYEAVASRGFAWEIDRRLVEVSPAADAAVETMAFVIDRVVDTSGWFSADFHIHATKSPDSDVPYDVRVRQAVTEELDMPVLTEHVYASNLAGMAQTMGLDEVIGVTGQEVTSFDYGHFNAFPMAYDESLPSNGAVSPYTVRPPELFELMRAQQPLDEIIQVNHPRSTRSYFDFVKLDPQSALPTENDEDWSLNWDAIEVFNGGCQATNEALNDWVALTNHGHRKVLASGSDTHHEDKMPGVPRNWIQLSPAEAAADHQAMVSTIRARRLFVSCGPFVRFTSGDGTVGLGGLMPVDDAGQAAFHVQVQAPSWMRLDELRLLRNGEEIQTVAIPDSGEVMRLDTVLTDSPEADAWYAVQVIGSGSMVPVTWSGIPFAMTNPIEVDADGDGAWSAPLSELSGGSDGTGTQP